MPRNLNMTSINDRWNTFYSVEEGAERVRKISFVTDKSNGTAKCGCDENDSLSCDLHDGSDKKNAQYFKLVNKYFAKHLSFNEKDVMDNLGQDFETISFCLQSTKDNITRLNKRKKEVFEEDVISALKRKAEEYERMLTPRIMLSEDFDPEWRKFLAKWDNSLADMASARKQQKLIKASVIRGGARQIDGSFHYEHMPYMHKLVGILENTEELVFMDFLMV